MAIAPTPPSRSSGGVSSAQSTQSRAVIRPEELSSASSSSSSPESFESFESSVGSADAVSRHRETSSSATPGKAAAFSVHSLRSAVRSENEATGERRRVPQLRESRFINAAAPRNNSDASSAFAPSFR